MISELTLKFARCFIVALMLLSFAGCKEQEGKAVKETQGEALPEVTLTDVKVDNASGAGATNVVIVASGTFQYSVVPKSDPERIIAVLHNTKTGNFPKALDINDGAISKIETVQLDTGRGPAAKITIHLKHKTPHEVVPTPGVLMITLPK